MKKYFFFFILTTCMLLSNMFFCCAQVSDNLIFSFDQFHVNPQHFAPSLVDTSAKFNLTMGDRSYRGVYSGINAAFLQANYFLHKINNQHHSVGMQIYHNKMGDFIRTTTFQVNYGLQIPLSQKLALTSGFNFGYKSMVLDPANVGGGGSAKALSSSLGLGLVSNQFTVLLGYKDFLNQNLKYDQFEIAMPVTYNLYLRYVKELASNWQVDISILGELTNQNNNNIRTTFITQWRKKMGIGAGYRKDKGVFALIGFTNIEWQRINFSTHISYLILPTIKFQNIPNQVVELTLGIAY